jgi:hypothetical protein
MEPQHIVLVEVLVVVGMQDRGRDSAVVVLEAQV